MVALYPHILRCVVATESEFDENGNIIPHIEQADVYDNQNNAITIGGYNVTLDSAETMKCRYVPNGTKVVRNAEGQSVVFSGTCYVSKLDALTLSNGDMISVPGFVDKPTPILQIHRAQLRTRIILQ